MQRALLVLGMLLSFLLPASARAQEVLADYPIPNGRFFSQASGVGPTAGYSITDDGGLTFFAEFSRLGGVAVLGYPASRRFDQGGFTTQATQRFLLQWRPELGHVVFGNSFDILSAAGKDPALQQQRMIPPSGDNSPDQGLSWDQVVTRHLAILDQNPTLKAVYLRAPDPVNYFGLPQAYADMGPAFVLRCQRVAFQQWKINTSFARAGQVTTVLGGDLLKESGLLPADAVTPEPASSVLVAPPGDPIKMPTDAVAAARQAAQAGRASTVQIVAALPQGVSQGTGIVLDATHVLTNNHVVEDSDQVKVVLVDGRSVPAQAVARDALADLAVITAPLPGGAVEPAQLADGKALREGDFVVALGFTPFFPSPPTSRVGTFGGVDTEVSDLLRTDTYILPGDSGGPLFDLRGRVIGVNEAIEIGGANAGQPLTGFSIDITSARPLVASLIANGKVARPFMGVQTVSVTPAVARYFGLAVNNGALVTGVLASSPAAAAGVRPGDVIVGVNADAVHSTRDLASVLTRYKPGDVVQVAVAGAGGRRTVRLVLGSPPG
jgi:serine protease DegS